MMIPMGNLEVSPRTGGHLDFHSVSIESASNSESCDIPRCRQLEWRALSLASLRPSNLLMMAIFFSCLLPPAIFLFSLIVPCLRRQDAREPAEIFEVDQQFSHGIASHSHTFCPQRHCSGCQPRMVVICTGMSAL